MSTTVGKSAATGTRLNRRLTLWGLIVIGMVLIQPTAPMGIFGVIFNKGYGHVVTTILIAMVAMLFTGISYGKMARVYPSAGSAYTYVGKEIHALAGYITGWSMTMDYILNPLITTAFCAMATMNIIPFIPFYAWIVFYAALFTWTNLRGIETSARINGAVCLGLFVVVLIFLAMVGRWVYELHTRGPGFFTTPFYNPKTFSTSRLFDGTSVAVMSYIGFDGVSTLSEEVVNPRRNILLATVLLCIITGILSGVESYAAQLVWGSKLFPDRTIESAFAMVSRVAGGVFLFQLINFALLVANFGSAMGAQLMAGRLLYGMGRGNALPKSFFGKLEPKRHIPRNSIIAVGLFALIGAGTLQFFSKALGGGAYEIGAEALNFGALLAFMGVNLAAFVHYWLRGSKKTILNFLPPILGFLICGFIWVHLSNVALILGGVWMAIGIGYGAYRTNGFRGAAISFDAPSEE